MNAFFLNSLDDTKLEIYKKSNLYLQNVLSSYEFSEINLSYYAEYNNNVAIDNSIIVFNNNDPQLVIYAHTIGDFFNHFGLPIKITEGYFNNESDKNLAYKVLIQKLNEILRKGEFKILTFYQNPFLLSEYYSKLEKNEVEYDLFVNLYSTEDELKSRLRRSYKSLVNWGEKHLKIELIDFNNLNRESFDKFKNFHIETAGKKTRSDESWNLQFEAIRLNEAFLVLAYLENKLVSGSFVLFGKKTAYYGVGVYDRNLMMENVPVGHYNILKSIYLAKEKGLEEFNLGGILSSNTNQKEMNIFKFKTGFSNCIIGKISFQINLT